MFVGLPIRVLLLLRPGHVLRGRSRLTCVMPRAAIAATVIARCCKGVKAAASLLEVLSFWVLEMSGRRWMET